MIKSIIPDIENANNLIYAILVIIVQKDDWTKDGTDVADVDEDTEIEYADRDGERFVTRDVSLSTGHHMQWIQSGFPRMSP